MTNSLKKNFFHFSLIIVAFFFIFDLGNLDGLRQGTEGFYLQVSKEMFNKGSFLTPYYQNIRHWSKPPLHFIFPFPFYSTNIFSMLFSARLSIALLTIFLLWLTSVWTEKHFKIAKYTTLLFFACSVGMIKYSRIFMMEIPLSLLTFTGSLYFYDYLIDKDRKSFLIALALISASVLIKGPVSFVLFGVSIFLFGAHRLYHQKENYTLPIIKFCLATALLSSFWFIISYLRYGEEFFNYFFLRENMGKFNTKSYPMRHVIQGLFIFSLPWSFYIPSSVKSLYNDFTEKNKDLKLKLYLLISTVIFLVIWLIPTQRSHHYAMPSVPFFLLLILITCFENKDNAIKDKFFKYSTYCVSFFFTAIILILAIATFYIDLILPGKELFLFMILSLTIMLTATFVFLRNTNITLKALSSLFFIGWLWVMVAPKFVSPFIPSHVITKIGKSHLTAYVRKPYFLEEAIGRKVNIVNKSFFQSSALQKDHLYLLNYDDYINYRLSERSTIQVKWDIWRRRTRVKHIIGALKSNDISTLRQSYVLFSAN